jgi:post-segregation antitoxin (ccd killing protein)
MVRVQVQLESAQHRQLKRRARAQGVSVAELVRRCIDAELRSQAGDARQDRVRRALAAAGRYRDPEGATDIARRHDELLAEAFRR